jgi:hypothetical protein
MLFGTIAQITCSNIICAAASILLFQAIPERSTLAQGYGLPLSNQFRKVPAESVERFPTTVVLFLRTRVHQETE